MKYRQALGMKLFAIFGLSVIYGCSTLGPNEIQRPQVPPDFPFAVVWLRPDAKTANINALTDRELLGLVSVKKWKEGDRDFQGMSMKNGKVYCTIEMLFMSNGRRTNSRMAERVNMPP